MADLQPRLPVTYCAMARVPDGGEDAPPLKERVYSTWYRLRYGWQFRSSVDIGGSPIWLLGKCYHVERTDDSVEGRPKEGVPPHVLAFLDHYYSLIWMTYRANFEPIPGTVLTTDCGWGCMVRSGQMMLANALQAHLLGRDWRLNSSSPEKLAAHKKVLSLFADCSLDSSPLSLHALMVQAQADGLKPGDWFGPSQVALLIRGCIERSRASLSELCSIQVYVAHDCTVYVGDVKKIFSDYPNTALLVLVPVRLGSDILNPIYIPCVKALLALDHSVGIIGGRPRHSVYFVGHQDEKLVHLDPHYCQVTINAKLIGANFDVKSYHCSTPRKLAAARMDPSCTVGFFCKGESDFSDLQLKAEPVLAPPKQQGLYPFFTFSKACLNEVIESSTRMRLATLGHDSVNDEKEDFLVVDCRTEDGPS